jgi:hypothetical protein
MSRDTDVRKLKSLIAVLVVFVSILFLVPIIWLMLMGDPLFTRVRSQFNSIAYIGSTVRASLGLSLFTKASPTGQRYHHIADRFDELIGKAIDGLNVNRIDETFLVVFNFANPENNHFLCVRICIADARTLLDS